MLLTDVSLPGGSGVELALAARRHHPELRVVFATGYALALTPPQREVLGDVAVLRKPYAAHELFGALSGALSGVAASDSTATGKP